MADATLDILRREAISRREKGMPGGNRIDWSVKDTVLLRDYGMAMPEEIIRAAPVARKFLDLDRAALLRSVAAVGVEVKRDMQAADVDFLYVISAEVEDLSNDLVKQPGIDTSSFKRNPVVPPFHDTTVLPVAASTAPWPSGNATLAIAKFPQPGISAESDQMAAAIRAGLFRGASIGFVPTRWSFSKDVNRPLGIDFHEIRLLEWSCVTVPCCPPCLLIGAVGSKSAPADTKMADRRREARQLTAKARLIIASTPDPVPQTRDQRLAEARSFRRIATQATK
jgi:hypothetical protein